MDVDGIKHKVLDFAEHHPYVLLAVISVLVIIIIIMYLNSRGYGVMGFQGKRTGRKKKEALNDDEEVDELIASIHKKQKRKE
jgi:hypothetical protein